jgi:hypothetical protein
VEIVLTATVVLIAVIAGYRMGKGDTFSMPLKKMKFSVRNEAQENEVIKKLEKIRISK